MACFRSWERDGHGEVGQGELIHGHSLLGSKYTLYSFKKPALALAALLAQACAKFITEMGPELEEGGERRHLVVQPLLPVPSAGSPLHRSSEPIGKHRTPVPTCLDLGAADLL